MPHAITESNRANWNQIHHARPGRPASYFAADGTTLSPAELSPAELSTAGDVRGRRVLQLPAPAATRHCPGQASGAAVVGVDISEVAIATATKKSTTAGIPADFLRADMLDLPSP